MTKENKNLQKSVETPKGEIQMDIYDYINSRDVAEHLKYHNYKFTTEEMVNIVGRSKKSQAERFYGFKWIMENFPDEPLSVYKTDLFYKDLKEQIIDGEFDSPFYGVVEMRLLRAEYNYDYDNEEYKKLYDELFDRVEKEYIERRNTIIEFNVKPFYTASENYEFHKKMDQIYKPLNPDAKEVTEQQKAAVDEKINNLFKNPIISYKGGVTKEEFDEMFQGSNSLFGMLHFFMNNIERFCYNEKELFPLSDLPVPFNPGNRVRPYWQTDGSVYVITDEDEDDEINCFIVYADGSIKRPEPEDVEFFECEFVRDNSDYSCSKTADFLGELILENWENGYKLTIEDVAIILNRQRKYMIELAQEDINNN